MILTQDDLTQIKLIVKETVDDSLSSALKPLREDIKALQNEVQAPRNDIKEIYVMIKALLLTSLLQSLLLKRSCLELTRNY
jgi:hypothetical protein